MARSVVFGQQKYLCFKLPFSHLKSSKLLRYEIFKKSLFSHADFAVRLWPAKV